MPFLLYPLASDMFPACSSTFFRSHPYLLENLKLPRDLPLSAGVRGDSVHVSEKNKGYIPGTRRCDKA